MPLRPLPAVTATDATATAGTSTTTTATTTTTTTAPSQPSSDKASAQTPSSLAASGRIEIAFDEADEFDSELALSSRLKR